MAEYSPSSFRDPGGFVFHDNGIIYRQINLISKENYDYLLSSGLYQKLLSEGLLVEHNEVDVPPPGPSSAYKVIKPKKIDFISYPYEWCFSQLKAAALATLKIQRMAMEHGMSLRDASAFNIQFEHGRPILIDTLSFEKYTEGEPWVAYRQFCQHFLGPLALMSYRDVRLNELMRIHIDGIPLDLASNLLPFRTRLILSLLIHIHLHARSQKIYADKVIDKKRRRMSRWAFWGLIDNLTSAIKRLNWRPKGTEWADYYCKTNYSNEAFRHKEQIINDYLEEIDPKTVWDLGANEGAFSRVAGKKGIKTIAFDIDPAAVEINYLKSIKNSEANILPLLIDINNPSPAIGWGNLERMSLEERGPVDAVLALALLHHLAISNNLPFNKLAAYLCKLGGALIIEFIPKNDSQVQKLLATRKDIFTAYTQPAFENEFKKYYRIMKSTKIRETERSLYLMSRLGA